MQKEFRNKEALIESIMESNEETWDNDSYLTLAIWKKQGLEVSEEQEKFIKIHAMAPENISRARRRLNERGKFLPESKQSNFWQ